MFKEDLALRNYAHIGDAVWELFVREYIIFKTNNAKTLHKLNTERVNTFFQRDLLSLIIDKLNTDELEIVRRARNLPIPVARKAIQKDYRLATAFEVLIGYWYLNNKDRLNYFYEFFRRTEWFS